MAEWILLVVGLLVAGAVVLAPLRRRGDDAAWLDDGAREAAAARHRAALEAIRDLEADRRAGLIDEAIHAAQLAEAEARAAHTRAALDALPAAAVRADERAAPHRARTRRAAIGAAAVIGAMMLGGALLPATGIANQTVTNRALADAQAAEAERRATIADLLESLGTDPTDPRTLSDLADAYLAGSTQDDLVRAAVALRVLVDVDPGRADAYERIMTAYLRAGDHENARAAHDAYVALETADPVEVAFFDGLIALRGENDPARALAAFDRFLELAPDDPRAPMIRGLRDEADAAS